LISNNRNAAFSLPADVSRLAAIHPSALKSLSQTPSFLIYNPKMISCNNSDPRTIVIESNQTVFLPTPIFGVPAHSTVLKVQFSRDLMETRENLIKTALELILYNTPIS
jgi:hypothetical protein